MQLQLLTHLVGKARQSGVIEVLAELFETRVQIALGKCDGAFDIWGMYLRKSYSIIKGAVAAVRSVSELPIVALMSFDSDGETIAGVSSAQAGVRLRGIRRARAQSQRKDARAQRPKNRH